MTPHPGYQGQSFIDFQLCGDTSRTLVTTLLNSYFIVTMVSCKQEKSIKIHLGAEKFSARQISFHKKVLLIICSNFRTGNFSADLCNCIKKTSNKIKYRIMLSLAFCQLFLSEEQSGFCDFLLENESNLINLANITDGTQISQRPVLQLNAYTIIRIYLECRIKADVICKQQ